MSESKTVLTVPLKQTEWTSFNRRHWFGHIVAAAGISAIVIGIRLADPSATIAAAAIVTWLVFYLSAVVMWMAICLSIWLTITILVYLDHSNRRQIFLTSLYTSISYFIWSILLSALFEIIFSVNPFPRDISGGGETELDYDKIWWLRRLFVVNWLLAALLIFRQYSLTKLRFGNRIMQYAAQVHDALQAQDMVDALTQELPSKAVLEPIRQHDEDEVNMTQYEAAVKLQGMFRGFLGRNKDQRPSTPSRRPNRGNTTKHKAELLREESEEVRKEGPINLDDESAGYLDATQNDKARDAEADVDLSSATSSKRKPSTKLRKPNEASVTQRERKKASKETLKETFDVNETHMSGALMIGFNAIRFTYLIVCRGRIAIKNRALAEQTADALFYEHEVGDEVAITALTARITDPRLSKRCAAIFDPHDAQRLSQDDMREAMIKMYHDRKHLALSLADLDSIVKAMGSFLNGAVAVVALFLLQMVFASGDFSDVAVSVGTTLFALSFIFADSARNVFNSFVFLFGRHSFDVGDRIEIQGYDPMYVVSMTLTQTTFRVWDGRVLTIANHLLYGMNMVNIRRSGPMMEALLIHVNIDTPWELLEELERRYRTFLNDNPKDFDEPKCAFWVRDIDGSDGNTLKVGMITMQKTNHQNGEHVPRRHKLIKFAHQGCRDLGIVYWRPRQRGAVLDSGPSHDMAQEEPTYELGDFARAEAEAKANRTSAKNSPASDTTPVRLPNHSQTTGNRQPNRDGTDPQLQHGMAVAPPKALNGNGGVRGSPLRQSSGVSDRVVDEPAAVQPVLSAV